MKRQAFFVMMVLCTITIYAQTKDPEIQELEYDGGMYTGEVLNSKPHGKGYIIYASDDPIRKGYDGEWVNGKRHGQGTMIWRNFDKYIGNWKEGLEDGEGICEYANGDKYVGHWKDGVEHGEGTCLYANGDKYVGNWEHGLWNGNGCLLKDGHNYIGNWKSSVTIETGEVLIECTDDDGHPFYCMAKQYYDNAANVLFRAQIRKFRIYVNKAKGTN